ncbi:MAG: ATP synthase F1 subunit epsilon [Candidatus Bipolaricaulota bacterium]|nr:ATP synthase F1 subunit epsilon [Candidatus Bipolaricaulota bacterium]
MHCQLQSPERMLFDGEAKIVVAHSPEGEFAVMNGHAPLLAALGPSPLRIKTEDEEHVFALSGGVLQVTKGGVTILAHEAIPVGEIDLIAVSACREELVGSEAAEADAFQGNTPPGEQEIAFLDVQKKLGENYE